MIGKKNRRFTKIMSLVLTLLMLVTAVPITVSAKNIESSETPMVETKQAQDDIDIPQASDKIADEVKEDMESNGSVEIIVYMKDKLDSISFAEKALAKHSKTMSQHKASLQVRRDLVLALKDQTHRTQYSLRKLVEKSQEQVNKFRSYFIANVAYMEVSPELVNKIAALPEVEKIRKNATYYLDDYEIKETEAPQEGEYLWSLEMVRAPEAWASGFTGEGAVVGLLDSGADYTHPAIHNKWRGLASDGSEDATYSWHDTVANEPLPVDSDTHGTHVCGTMVGEDETAGVATGVAPDAKWICARVFDPTGATTDAKLLDAAEWMVAPGGNPDMAPDAVNNSWGGGSAKDDWYMESVDNYIAAGIVPVFSAGNQRMFEPTPQPGSISNPAHYPNSLAVAAIDKNKIRPSWSKRGPSPYTDNWKPELSAPGVNITSSLPGGRYGEMSGTSMAAPHVTASIALLRSANNTLTVEQIKNVLYEYAEPLTDDDPNARTSPNHDYGYGLIDVFDSIAPVAGDFGKFVGKVLREGADTGPAVITHEQTVEEVYLGNSLEVEAEIIDDVSVLDAYLMVKADGQDWQKLALKQIDGDARGGTYVGNIPANAMGSGESFSYKFVAKDYVNNQSESEVFTVSILFGVIPGEYYESFEGTAEGWTMDPLWSVGAPSAEGEPEVPHGEQYIGTAIGGEYGANEDAFLISVPIDMRQADEASVRFLHWHSLSKYIGDKATIYITNDYGETLTEFNTYNKFSNGWQGVVIDLSPYAYSDKPVHIIFRIKTDGYAHDLGWYIDNFEVEAEDNTPPPAPTNLEAMAGLGSIKLTWDFALVPDFNNFKIYRSTAAGELGTLIGTAGEQMYQDSYINLEDDTEYYYTVKATDLFENISEKSNQASAKKADSQVVISWDFEDDDAGFTTGETKGETNDWEWGQVAESHGPGSALTGTNVWATGLDKNYSKNCDAYIVSPEITIPTNGATFLTLNHWYFFERFSNTGNKWDYGQIFVKVSDEDTWKNVTPVDDGKFGGPPEEEETYWHYEEIDLSAYAGDTIEVRFFYHTDGGGFRAGWFLNDVNIINVPQGSSATNFGHEKFSQGFKTQNTADLSLDFTTVGSVQDYELSDYSLNNIPIPAARVEVVESGQTVTTNDRTGDYTIKHKVSEEGEVWTLKAEAYGYVPEYFESALNADETVEHIFILHEKARGTITGQVYDRYSHDPAAYATVTVVEDPHVDPVIADENGYFTIENVYVGEYTLHASADEFESGTATVTVEADETANCDIPLKRFVGIPGEIIYDDGEGENATVLVKPGGGIAMRFTPESFGKLINASFYFWDETWPQPGGNEIGFAVFEKDGSSYTQIAPTIYRDDIERGAWYTIDLSHLNFTTGEDFIVSTIQSKDGDHSPGLGLDESAAEEASERSYFYSDGSFMDFPSQDYADYGAMIRATMEYSADSPTITNLNDVNYTNADSTPVEGIVDYDQGNVLIYAGEDVASIVEPENIVDNSFATSVDLLEEETYITASLKVGEKETEPSEEKLVIKDQIAPELKVAEPYDGQHVNVELIHVKGKATDKYFDKLMINGDEVTVNTNGTYDYRLIVEEGANDIEVVAVDKAGNETREDLTVYAAYEDVYITDMQPAEDLTMAPGETVELSFRAPSGGHASYTVIPPSSLFGISKASKFDMIETESGLYKGTWTAIDSEFEDAEIYFEFTDAYGTYIDATAPGRITVVKGNLLDRLYGSNRYKTATKLSQLMYEEAETVILASGENFPDALVGGSYAEELDVPILLTRQADLPEETLAELGRLGTTKVIILGGPLAISSEVESTLEEVGLEVERIAGSNRYKTAVEIARLARAEESTHVFIASGEKFEDALSIVPAVALSDDALLLTSKAGLHEATLAALEEFGTESITLMGGELVIPKVIEEELKDLGYAVDRIAGSNRYKTNIQIAEQYFPAATKVIGASGVNFPDALVATVYAAKEGRPIILLDPDGLRDVTVEYFEDKPIEHVLLMGGPLAIPRAVEYHILGILQDK